MGSTSLANLAKSNGALNRVWPSPSWNHDTAGSTRGLGGGLTFAYDDSICDELLPSFIESEYGPWGIAFITCDNVKQAIRSAFASWSSNHPVLKFHDGTRACCLPRYPPCFYSQPTAHCSYGSAWHAPHSPLAQ